MMREISLLSLPHCESFSSIAAQRSRLAPVACGGTLSRFAGKGLVLAWRA
jgi:hypothetical protein